MSTLESDIEREVRRYAIRQRVVTFKINALGERGRPDRIFLFQGSILFIEFKRPGEEPRALQRYYLKLLRFHRFRAEVVDDIGYGKSLIDQLTASDY